MQVSAPSLLSSISVFRLDSRCPDCRVTYLRPLHQAIPTTVLDCILIKGAPDIFFERSTAGQTRATILSVVALATRE